MTPFDITFCRSGASHPTVLTASEHFRFETDRIDDFFAATVPSLLADFLRIGMAVYVVDRLVRRRRRDQQRRWSRSLVLKVGVLEPNIWNTDEIRDSLIECLEFLTDDTWDISFEQDDRRKPSEIQRRLFAFSTHCRLCLYSGGLDSAAGLASQLLKESGRPAIPITVWHQGGQRFNVQRQIDLIKTRCNFPDLNPLIFKAHLLEKARIQRKEEPTQRSRAFLFMAAAAVAASMCGGSEVEVYESGIGAINLPLMAGMTGSRTTRSTHPEFLRLMSHLASLVSNRHVSFTLPFIDRTKGQVVAELAQSGLSDLARATVSCSSYPLREKKYKQCGVCSACLFRRQAMLTAGIAEDADTYKHDLFSALDVPKSIPSKLTKNLKAFLMQVAELEQVQSGRRLPERVLRHLMGTGILQNGQSAAPFIRLLRQYRQEWLEVARQAGLLGYSWTKLLEPVDSLTQGASRA